MLLSFPLLRHAFLVGAGKRADVNACGCFCVAGQQTRGTCLGRVGPCCPGECLHVAGTFPGALLTSGETTEGTAAAVYHVAVSQGGLLGSSLIKSSECRRGPHSPRPWQGTAQDTGLAAGLP